MALFANPPIGNMSVTEDNAFDKLLLCLHCFQEGSR